MENKNQNETEVISDIIIAPEKISNPILKKENYIPASILISSIILAGAWMYTSGPRIAASGQGAIVLSSQEKAQAKLEESVLPSKGVTLPVTWGNLGSELVKNGSIDGKRFQALYEGRGQFTPEYNQLLNGTNNGKIKITKENSGYLLNLLWAFGLANKNDILEKGEMVDPQYGGAKGFASTGGWTMAVGNPMDHYSKHQMVTLTPDQQALVDKVSRGIFRPCCGNSVHFPDCNHGMAMLGLLELMASQGVSEQDMWNTALTVNSYWFPNNYLTIATYEKSKGIEWKDVNPIEILGASFSSSRGYANIASQVTQPQSSGSQSGSGCGVDAGGSPAAPAPQQQSGGSGCGV